jgi:hypothetical protein
VIETESAAVATTPSHQTIDGSIDLSRPTPSHAEGSNQLGIVSSDDVVVPLAAVEVGMAFAADVVAANGVLLVARGQTATASLVQRIENYWSDFAGELNVRILRSSVTESMVAAGTLNAV